MNFKKIAIFSVFFSVLAANLFFGLPRLGKYSAVDEPYWTYDRTPQFWNALKKMKWRSTNINDKPGITVAIISGLGLPWGNPLAYKSIRQESKTESISQGIQQINFNLRLPVYLTTLGFIALFYWFVKKILGNRIALISIIFIGLSPIILGVSLIINPDSLLWGFLPLSILSYLVHQKTDERKYLFLSGVLLGLSLLTKYVANILFVYLLGLLFAHYVFENIREKNLAHYLKKSFFDYFLLSGSAILTFFIFFPAAWLSPKIVLEGTFISVAFRPIWPFFAGFIFFILADIFLFKSRIAYLFLEFLKKRQRSFFLILSLLFLLGLFFVLLNSWTGMKLVDFESIVASPKGDGGLAPGLFISQILADLYTLIFSLSPLVLFFFAWAMGRNLFSRKSEMEENRIVFYFAFFILLYYAASTASHVVATTRYQIVVFPLAFIIAAIGLDQFLRIFKEKFFSRDFFLYPALITLSLICLFKIKPFYFAYASSLLPQNYVLNLKDMGDGSFEAAQYLNRLPEAKSLTIWSDKGAVCETFLGTCKVGFSRNDTKGIQFDYFVVSAGRKNRSLKLESAGFFEPNINFEKLYSADFPGEKKFVIGGRENNFIKIVKTEDVAIFPSWPKDRPEAQKSSKSSE